MTNKISETIKNLRKTAKLSQVKLAEKLNVHAQTISKWERGISEPDISQMSELSAALNISLEKLFGCEEGEHTFTGDFSAEKLGEYISFLRTQINESQQQLAEVCSSSADAVSRWERGVTCPDVNSLIILAEHFNTPISKLYYAVSDEVITPRVIKGSKNRKTIIGLSSALAVATAAAATILTVFLIKQPNAEQPVPVTITVDGIEQTVNQNDWFMPQAGNRTGYDFIGWRDANGTDIAVPHKVTEEIELYSVYAPHEYTVNYWLNGGSFQESVSNIFTLESGDLDLPIPKKEGAVFGGWYLVPDYSEDAVTQITCEAENVHLYAKWDNIFYTVTVDGAEQSIAQGEWFTPQAENRTGYDFIGWHDADGNSVTAPYKVIEDCTFISVFSPHEYEIEYWLNGGVFGTAEVQTSFTVESGVVELSVPDKNGAAFEGWFLTDDYSGDAVMQIACEAKNVLLYAKWSDQTYTVRYKLNGGILYESNPESVTIADEVVLNNPLREGYRFLGWYDAQEGGNRVTAVGGGNAKNLTCYAQWQKSEAIFTIDYVLNGGTQGIGNPDRVKVGEMIVLSEPTKHGHAFIGWNLSADGKGEFVTKVYGEDENITLYAIFEPKQYLIRYIYEGMYLTEEVNPNYIIYEEDLHIALIPVYRYGYDFLGWFDHEESGSLIEIIDSENVTEIPTLYAHFSIYTYQIKLDGNGGSFATPEGVREAYCYTLPFNGSLTLPEGYREGYDFLGWKDSAGNSVEKLNIQNIANMTLTAFWLEQNKQYSITLEPNGGTVDGGNIRKVDNGDTIILPVPERNGYLFLGWNDKADESGEFHNLTKSDWQDDITLYAVWQEIKTNGSSEFFEYTKGAESVTITKYLGESGENINVVYPALIEGLPVKAIEGKLNRHNSTSTSLRNTFRSVTIPEGVEEIGKNVFFALDILQPIVIPASVLEIDENCFRGTCAEIYFAEGNSIEKINKNVFNEANIANVMTLPATVKTIEQNAFYAAKMGGLVLPEGLTTIMGSAMFSSSLGDIYLPTSVTYVGQYALDGEKCNGKVFTSQSKAQISVIFPSQWYVGPSSNIIYNHTAHNVTLKDGDWTESYNEKYVVLSQRQKEGYRFLGWQNESGEFVSTVFIPSQDIVLTAAYEEKTDCDGRARDSAISIKPNESFQMVCRSGDTFYCSLESVTDISCVCKISYKSPAAPGYTTGSTDYLVCSNDFKFNTAFDYTVGNILTFKVDGIPKPLIITITFLSV
ncbi:MAG: InlB B-repeat-containing protein [Clostridia bacterium]|nr:InlB B-repeat-containing protein [Clostridia bacterium]